MSREQEVMQQQYNMQRSLMAEQATMAAMQREQGQSYTESLKEFSEYVREFSMDKVIKVADSHYESGTVPENNFIKYWSIHSPNFVFGNIREKNEKRKIKLMELGIELADSMYTVNYEALNRLPPEDREAISESVTKEKMSVLDASNQHLYTYMRATRAQDGKERELMVTKSLVAGTTSGGQDKKRSMLGSVIGGFFRK
jgi:hypothetical protein